MKQRAHRPTGVTGFSIFNLIIGSFYALTGFTGFFADFPLVVAAYFALSGTLLVIGSGGVLAGRQWAQRFTTWGLGLVVAMNGLISVILAFLVLFWAVIDRSAGGEIEGAFALFIGFTMVQLLGFIRLRKTDVAEFLWAQTEAELGVGAHEKVVLDFDYQESGEAVETERSTWRNRSPR